MGVIPIASKEFAGLEDTDQGRGVRVIQDMAHDTVQGDGAVTAGGGQPSVGRTAQNAPEGLQPRDKQPAAPDGRIHGQPADGFPESLKNIRHEMILFPRFSRIFCYILSFCTGGCNEKAKIFDKT